MPKLCVSLCDTAYLEELIATVPHGYDNGFGGSGIGFIGMARCERLGVWRIVKDVMGKDQGEKWLFFRDDLDSSAIRLG